MTAIGKLRRLRKALKALDVDEKRGTLTAYGDRFLFIPVKLIHSIEDRLVENLGPVTATSFQYEIGKEGGAHYMRLAEKAGYDMRDARDVRKVAESLGTMGGWGKLEVKVFDLEKRIVRVRWTNGISVRNRKGKTPVCHFGRGILTGATEVIFGRECESIEITCEGKGDACCEAIIGDPGEISRLADTRNR